MNTPKHNTRPQIRPQARQQMQKVERPRPYQARPYLEVRLSNRASRSIEASDVMACMRSVHEVLGKLRLADTAGTKENMDLCENSCVVIWFVGYGIHEAAVKIEHRARITVVREDASDDRVYVDRAEPQRAVHEAIAFVEDVLNYVKWAMSVHDAVMHNDRSKLAEMPEFKDSTVKLARRAFGTDFKAVLTQWVGSVYEARYADMVATNHRVEAKAAQAVEAPVAEELAPAEMPEQVGEAPADPVVAAEPETAPMVAPAVALDVEARLQQMDAAEAQVKELKQARDDASEKYRAAKGTATEVSMKAVLEQINQAFGQAKTRLLELRRGYQQAAQKALAGAAS